MATALLEAPAPHLLRRIVGGRWTLVPQQPVPARLLPAAPAPQAGPRLQRRAAELPAGPPL